MYEVYLYKDSFGTGINCGMNQNAASLKTYFMIDLDRSLIFEMKTCLLVIALCIYFQSILCKDPVSDYDLAWTLFSIGDSNHNERLEASEISRFYKKALQFPQELADFVGESMIERGDINGDNGLSFEETVMAMASVRQQT
ncbi:uncharacterized protein [Mytilus edulis]|uniref:uncharacterized protein n=1 Tax=Mytilus edulis TaxID=6550 RepID=UPI0039F0E498